MQGDYALKEHNYKIVAYSSYHKIVASYVFGRDKKLEDEYVDTFFLHFCFRHTTSPLYGLFSVQKGITGPDFQKSDRCFPEMK